MKKYFVLIFLSLVFLTPNLGLAQEVISITRYVADKKTKEPLPYAIVRLKKTNRATATNLDGNFQFSNISISDTLFISFLGYFPSQLSVLSIQYKDTIFLNQRTEKLPEIILLGDNGILFEMIAQARKTGTKEAKTSKTYFSLESRINNKQVEFVEAYYNAKIKGYDLQSLKLKNGRIALNAYQDQYFISKNSSRAIVMQKAVKKNDFFPVSPLEVTRTKLKNTFELVLEELYINSNARTIYHIQFYPKQDSAKYFYGSLWLDSASYQILKVNLNNDSKSNHPFVPIFPDDTIKNAILSITKDFENIEGSMYLSSINFNYTLSYVNNQGNAFNIYSKAYIKPYDYSQNFNLPLFNVNPAYYSDYRLILSAPYNSHFWENINEFEFNKQNQNKVFGSNNEYSNVPNNAPSKFFKKYLFELSYMPWKKQRLFLLSNLPINKSYNDYEGLMPSKRYNIETVYYLDYNHFKGMPHVFCQTLYDPYKSFFYYPITAEINAFVNMTIDISEIEKRKQLSTLDSLNLQYQTLIPWYENLVEANQINKNQFFKEAERGNNKIMMKKWNEIIFKELKIDNLKDFTPDSF